MMAPSSLAAGPGPGSSMVGGGSSGVDVVGSMMTMSAADPTALLHTQLASALSTMGDAQYWEETISPSNIRTSLQNSDPSNPSSTPTLVRGMKWLLASISKGRDVSDFFAAVVKLVGAPSLEVRKMVYLYLVQYADHNATTRELSLLSINSFQRGLADHEQLIRGLALRVLSSIRIPDILQIQILAVQTCSKDRSPYVRKCAAVALAKLYPRCSTNEQEDAAGENIQQTMLLDMMVELLDTDTCTMVLTSVVIAFCEICPHRLDLLHTSYRKLCHLLTDMDEWGQVVIIDVLIRYCRTFFCRPKTKREAGAAELIDQKRRVQRTISSIQSDFSNYYDDEATSNNATSQEPSNNTSNTDPMNIEGGEQASSSAAAKKKKKAKKIKVQKGFYSDDDEDEDDDSSEDDSGDEVHAFPTVQTRNVMGIGGGMSSTFSDNVRGRSTFSDNVNNTNMNSNTPVYDDDDELGLDEDHKLLLQSSLSLLKSRNSGVVLAVCGLLYYCGVSSIKTRSAIGKALVRIHRDKREIQYVVLTSIQSLVRQCPSAFAPFLQDFFVKAMDPPFTRGIKLDILTSLALEPIAIEAVLTELRTYIRHVDRAFCMASIRAVGKVSELARVVYDRHASTATTEEFLAMRETANRIALDCLYGLSVVTQSSDHSLVVGECICVMQTILLLLLDQNGRLPKKKQLEVGVHDPNQVQDFAWRRIVLLLIHALLARISKNVSKDNTGEGDSDDSDNDNDADDIDGTRDGTKSGDRRKLNEVTSVLLPPRAVASALWMVGEYMSPPMSPLTSTTTMGAFQTNPKMRLEIIRLVDRAFLELDPVEKEQGIHFASKQWVAQKLSVQPSSTEVALCEHILCLGRLDVNPDVRDRARHESAVLHRVAGLQFDSDTIAELSGGFGSGNDLALDDAKKIFLGASIRTKPPPSYLRLQANDGENTDEGTNGTNTAFRFGTLSSLVGHKARGTYIPLPPWAESNSPKSLRDPAQQQESASGGWNQASKTGENIPQNFYADDKNDDDSSSSSSDSSSSSSSSGSSSTSSADGERAGETSSDSESSSSSSSSSSDDDNVATNNFGSGNNLMGALPNVQTAGSTNLQPAAQDNFLGMFTSAANPNMSSGFQQQQQAPRAVMQSSSDDDSSDDDSSSSSSDGGDADISALSEHDNSRRRVPVPSSAAGSEGTLLSLMKAQPTAPTQSSTMDDLRGLVMAPIVVDEPEAVADPNSENDSSAWIQLVRPEHCGGLAIQVRYLRGPTKVREVQLKGLDPTNPSLVCLEVHFANKKMDTGSLRRIRILPRSSASGPYGTKKIICPQEIPEMRGGQQSSATLCIEFASSSNREGDLVAKLDVKSATGGGVPVQIKPTIGELLRPCKIKIPEFDSSMERMQGFQRIESKFTLPRTTTYDLIPTFILKRAALTIVDNKKISNKQWLEHGKLRLIGMLPASNDLVYVLVQCNKTTGTGKIIICCDHAVAVTSITNLIKMAIVTPPEQY